MIQGTHGNETFRAWAYENAAMPFRERFGMGNVVGNGDGNGENFIFFTDFLLFSALGQPHIF